MRAQTQRQQRIYFRQRAWHWSLQHNYALAADYCIRLLNEVPRDALGLLLGEVAGRNTGQDEFATKCREAQVRLMNSTARDDVQHVVDLIEGRPGAPSTTEVKQWLEDSQQQLSSSSLLVNDGGDATIAVTEAATLEECQQCVRRAAMRSSPSSSSSSPLVELLEPKQSACGRGIFATRRIATRTSILVDEPVLVMRTDTMKVCAHCLATLTPRSTVACQHCEDETYCSEACRDLAWSTYHACGCSARNPGYAAWQRTMRESMEGGGSASDSGSHARAALACLTVAKMCAMATMQQQHPLAVDGIRVLRGQADFDPSTALAEIGGLAVSLSELFHQPHLFMEEILSLFALVQTNEFLTSRGVCLYSCLSMLNHSCDPNCAIVGAGRDEQQPCVKRLVALREVRDGEQLFIDYNAHLTTKLRYEERKALCAQRHFECFCAKCVRRE